MDTRRDGREIRQPTGVWSVTSEGRVASTTVEQHLIYLLDRLVSVIESLLALAREQDVAADFFCYWVSATDNGALASHQTRSVESAALTRYSGSISTGRTTTK